MSTPAPSFELEMIQDLASLIQKLSEELQQQKELLDPKAFTLIRLYLSAIRQYMSLKKHRALEDNPKPAGSPKPANTPRLRPALHSLFSLNHSNPTPPESFPAPGLLMSVPEPAAGAAVRADLSSQPREPEGPATRLK